MFRDKQQSSQRGLSKHLQESFTKSQQVEIMELINELENEITAWQSKYNSLKNKYDILDRHNMQAEFSDKQMSKDVSRQQYEISMLNQQISDFQKREEQMKQENQKLMKFGQEQDKIFEEKLEQIFKLNGEIDSLKEQIMEHQNEIIQLKAEMKAKDKRIESFSLTDQANSIYTRKATFDKSQMSMQVKQYEEKTIMQAEQIEELLLQNKLQNDQITQLKLGLNKLDKTNTLILDNQTQDKQVIQNNSYKLQIQLQEKEVIIQELKRQIEQQKDEIKIVNENFVTYKNGMDVKLNLSNIELEQLRLKTKAYEQNITGLTQKTSNIASQNEGSYLLEEQIQNLKQQIEVLSIVKKNATPNAGNEKQNFRRNDLNYEERLNRQMQDYPSVMRNTNNRSLSAKSQQYGYIQPPQNTPLNRDYSQINDNYGNQQTFNNQQINQQNIQFADPQQAVNYYNQKYNGQVSAKQESPFKNQSMKQNVRFNPNPNIFPNKQNQQYQNM